MFWVWNGGYDPSDFYTVPAGKTLYVTNTNDYYFKGWRHMRYNHETATTSSTGIYHPLGQLSELTPTTIVFVVS